MMQFGCKQVEASCGLAVDGYNRARAAGEKVSRASSFRKWRRIGIRRSTRRHMRPCVSVQGKNEERARQWLGPFTGQEGRQIPEREGVEENAAEDPRALDALCV